jgi:hypothetical protein
MLWTATKTVHLDRHHTFVASKALQLLGSRVSHKFSALTTISDRETSVLETMTLIFWVASFSLFIWECQYWDGAQDALQVSGPGKRFTSLV